MFLHLVWGAHKGSDSSSTSRTVPESKRETGGEREKWIEIKTETQSERVRFDELPYCCSVSQRCGELIWFLQCGTHTNSLKEKSTGAVEVLGEVRVLSWSWMLSPLTISHHNQTESLH